MDRVRNTGPETSVPPPLSDEAKEELAKAQSTLAGKARADGRSPEDCRKIFVKPGTVTQARGSAYVEVGQTKVVAACYGPRDTLRTREYNAKGKLQCELRLAAFACQKRVGPLPTSRERGLSDQLAEALRPAVCLDKYPKSLVDVYVTVVQDDGSCLAAAITASSVALADAGIEMFDLVAGCTCGLAAEGEAVVFDPTHAEEAQLGCLMTVAYMPSLSEVAGIHQTGALPFGQSPELLKGCLQCCANVGRVQQQVLCAHAHKGLCRRRGQYTVPGEPRVPGTAIF